MSHPADADAQRDSGIEQGLQSLSLTESGSVHSGSGGTGGSAADGLQVSNRKADRPLMFETLCQRPGEVNTKICRKTALVCVNQMRLKVKGSLEIFQYNLEFYVKNRAGAMEQVVKREKTAEYFWCLVNDEPRLFTDPELLVFNDVNILYCSKRLNISDGQRVFQLRFRSRDPQTGRYPPPRENSRPTMVEVRITTVPVVLVRDLSATQTKDKDFLTSFYDLVISQDHRRPFMNANYGRFVTKGRTLYKVPANNEAQSIGCGMEMWKGLHSAVKWDNAGGPMINSNMCSSAYYKRDLNLVTMLAELLGGWKELKNVDWREVAVRPDDIRVKKLLDIVKGKKVQVRVPNANVGYKKVAGFSRGPASQERFQLDNGQWMSVEEYFFNKNIRLEAPHLPCIEVKSTQKGRRNALYPLEFCFTDVAEAWKHKGRVNEQQLAAMIRASTASTCIEAKNCILKMVNSTTYLDVENRTMSAYGIGIEKDFLKVPAKFLPQPGIVRGGGQMCMPNETTGEYNMQQQDRPVQPARTMQEGVTLVPFVATVVPCQKRANNFIVMFQTLKAYGIRIDQTAGSIELVQANPQAFEGFCQYAVNKCETLTKEKGTKHVPLTFWVFKFKDQGMYGCLKYYCDTKYGILSQCVLDKVAENLTGNPVTNTTATNILLKVLAKVGGIYATLDREVHKNWAKVTNKDEPTLFLAIDASHPGAEERAKAKEKLAASQRNSGPPGRPGGPQARTRPGPSVSSATGSNAEYSFADCPRSMYAVVGNVDIEAMHYLSSARVQRIGQELGTRINELIEERIRDFMEFTGGMPKHIVVYRDGVSDGEMRKALHEESKALEEAVAKFGHKLIRKFEVDPDTGKEFEVAPEEGQITFTYIVAQKRHHTRFFPDRKEEAAGKALNVQPGMLVESEVVSKDKFDFYVLAHAGPLGVSRPVRYTVLRNTWQTSTSFWQSIIYAQCFGYACATKTVSMPIPLMYAHRAANKSRFHFAFFREFDNNYADPRIEECAKVEMEQASVRIHPNLKALKSMSFC